MKQYRSLLWFLLPLVDSLSLSPRQQRVPTNQGHADATVCRREMLALGPAAALLVPYVANAVEQATVNDLLTSLKGVPTFCLVNSQGASYMLVKAQERMAKGYAFTTFEGALAVLADAQRTAEEKGYADLWKDATITTIPADIAVRLSLKKVERTSQKDQSLDTLLSLIPSADDREDAIKIDKKFNDQGRVPLFYFDGFQLPSNETPLYFSKQDLLAEWKRQNADKPPPKVQVLDMVYEVQNTLLGRGSLPKNTVFVPLEQSVKVSKELKSRGLAPYKVDRMVV